MRRQVLPADLATALRRAVAALCASTAVALAQSPSVGSSSLQMGWQKTVSHAPGLEGTHAFTAQVRSMSRSRLDHMPDIGPSAGGWKLKSTEDLPSPGSGDPPPGGSGDGDGSQGGGDSQSPDDGDGQSPGDGGGQPPGDGGGQSPGDGGGQSPGDGGQPPGNDDGQDPVTPPDLTPHVTPEPATWALFATGLVALIGCAAIKNRP